MHRRVLADHRLVDLSRSGARTRDVVELHVGYDPWADAAAALAPVDGAAADS